VPPATWEALAGLRGGGLTRLELPFNRLRELPSGEYLAGLKVWDWRVGWGWSEVGCFESCCSELRLFTLHAIVTFCCCFFCSVVCRCLT
jgi:hypothetical protein